MSLQRLKILARNLLNLSDFAHFSSNMTAYSPSDLIARFPDWHYADFEQRAFQLSAAFQQQQIQSVALWFSDCAKLTCTMLAAWHSGVRLLFVPNLTIESIEWANQYADFWLSDQAISNHTIKSLHLFDDFAQDVTVKSSRPLLAFKPNSEMWLKTSGSSGTPKTIVKTARQLWLNGLVCGKDFAFPAGNHITAICTVSIQHLYGLICQIMMPFQLGWQMARKQQFFPEDVQLLSKQSAQSVLISSPTMLASIDWQRLSFPNLKGVVSAGGMLSPALDSEVAQHLGFPITDFYGTTEAGAIAYRRGVPLWQPMTGANIGVDERSALWIEADWLESREQSEDIIEWHGKQFAMLGRADRIIKLGDKRTSLLQLEQALAKHPWVVDNYIAKHPIKQQRLAAWVALNEQGLSILALQGRKAVIAELRTYLAQAEDKTALPRFWRFTDILPRNSQSKISKMIFEQQFSNEDSD